MKIAVSLATLGAMVTILLAIFSEDKPISSILSETGSTPGTLDVYGKGNLSTTYFNVNTTSPPRPLLVVTPNVSGTYHVVLFLHGTCMLNSFYTDLLQHVSSYGYIVVAPQLYKCFLNLIPPKGPVELEYAVKVANWLPCNLASVLPKNVEANLTNIALAGHSRGGKTAFALALGKNTSQVQVKFSAVIGVDPVAGLSKMFRTKPHILSYVPGSFNLTIPVAVIGTGLGNQTKLGFACAPQDVNHVEFFLESRPPSGHFVTTDYGHMDMLNDHLDGVIIGTVAGALCKSGKPPNKDPMRRTIGGIVVAFLKACFEDDNNDYFTILGNRSEPPVTLRPVESKPPVTLRPVEHTGPPNHPQPQVNFNYIDGSAEL